MVDFIYSSMHKNKKQFLNTGFTIIELLVVISIIAILSSLSVSLFSDASAKSRDARREKDIKQLQNALALYANDVQGYPICSSEVTINGTSDCLSAALISKDAIPAAPMDPRNGVGSGSCGNGEFYSYCYVSSDGRSYAIRYLLETNTIQGKSSGWQTAGP